MFGFKDLRVLLGLVVEVFAQSTRYGEDQEKKQDEGNAFHKGRG